MRARGGRGPRRVDRQAERRRAGASTLGMAALFGVTVLLSSCGSGSPSPGSAPPTTHRPPTHGTTTTSTGVTATTSTPVSTLPEVSTTGPLQVGAPIPLPFSADQVAAAESPDGAVFTAPEDPTSPSPTVAWVVDANGPAAVAEHVATGIAALAADSADFYVATYGNVFAYDRLSGNPVGQWVMPPVGTADSSSDDLVSMAAAGGAVLLSVTQGDVVRVYRIDPTSSAAPRLVVRGLGVAVGPDGSIYYERTDFRLAVLRPDGSTLVGPALAHTPNSLGGGVQYVDTVAGGGVWVSDPAGQGLDDSFTTYDAATLRPVGSYAGVVGTAFADSAGGSLALVPAGSASGCPVSASGVPVSCVFRIDAQGRLSDPVGVGSAVTLLGPGPAVVTSDTSTGQFDLLRLS